MKSTPRCSSWWTPFGSTQLSKLKQKSTEVPPIRKKHQCHAKMPSLTLFFLFTRTVVLTQVLWIGYQCWTSQKIQKNFWGKMEELLFQRPLYEVQRQQHQGYSMTQHEAGILSQDQGGKSILLLTFKETSELHGQLANYIHIIYIIWTSPSVTKSRIPTSVCAFPASSETIDANVTWVLFDAL